MSSTKPNKKITWANVLITFISSVALPVSFILYAAWAVDTGFYGGQPGFVSGDSPIVWIIERLHIVIIGAFFGSLYFLYVLFLKLWQLVSKEN